MRLSSESPTMNIYVRSTPRRKTVVSFGYGTKYGSLTALTSDHVKFGTIKLLSAMLYMKGNRIHTSPSAIDMPLVANPHKPKVARLTRETFRRQPAMYGGNMRISGVRLISPIVHFIALTLGGAVVGWLKPHQQRALRSSNFKIPKQRCSGRVRNQIDSSSWSSKTA